MIVDFWCIYSDTTSYLYLSKKRVDCLFDKYRIRPLFPPVAYKYVLLGACYTGYKETFSLFDKNGDNKISTDELFTVMMALGQELTQQDMKNIMVELDANSKLCLCLSC